jgi:hypothetical protein
VAAPTTLAPEIASALARTVLANVVRECPAKPNHVPEDNARAAPMRSAADIHVAAGMTGPAGGEYTGEHWLATFALPAPTADCVDRSALPAGAAAC